MAKETDRSRSRSPYRQSESPRKRKRSRSPYRKHKSSPQTPVQLPVNARPLVRHDLNSYWPMFALYLDIQKHIDIDELSSDEVKGRWRSFIGKWNRGELAEGWYDSKTLQKAQNAARGNQVSVGRKASPGQTSKPNKSLSLRQDVSDEDEDEYGPHLPASLAASNATASQRPGPAMPRLDDLQIQRELLDDDLTTARRAELEALHMARKAERKNQAARLDEFVPKAEPGTRERQLEKKKEKAAANKSFADGHDVEVPDAEIMGGGDSLDDLKKLKQAQERKKSEREIRREEVFRAKQSEREERVRGMREKEEKTMAMLQEIAKARFGTGNDHNATLG